MQYLLTICQRKQKLKKIGRRTEKEKQEDQRRKTDDKNDCMIGRESEK